MILSSFILFLLSYFFSSKRDKVIFKTSGWLYFISHYQLFLFGFALLAFICFLLIVGFTYSLFFHDSSSLFFSIILMLLFLPFSIDCIYYGLFGISFFKEQYIKSKKFKSIKKINSGFSFNYFMFSYVKFIYFCFSLFFFIFSYLFLIFVYTFVFWSIYNEKKPLLIYIFLFESHLLSFFLFIIFIFPFFIETMSYAYRGNSYFIKFIDY
ncbi:hypothetical protein [Alphaproteobacteria bacterium endosymbiont of Tiliacea citrago]|uniref:hypothetical protein n=1 Tax=Alphaproteobacteria bacterium endosymbiont of Tiliacea citrago TaxID=3077944 RepID=UPI00313DBE26